MGHFAADRLASLASNLREATPMKAGPFIKTCTMRSSSGGAGCVSVLEVPWQLEANDGRLLSTKESVLLNNGADMKEQMELL